MTDIKETIDALMRAQVIEALDKNKDMVLRHIIREVLDKNIGSGWNSETLLQQIMRDLVRGCVTKIISEILEQREAELRSAVMERMNEQFFAKFKEKLTIGLAENLEINFKMKD